MLSETNKPILFVPSKISDEQSSKQLITLGMLNETKDAMFPVT